MIMHDHGQRTRFADKTVTDILFIFGVIYNINDAIDAWLQNAFIMLFSSMAIYGPIQNKLFQLEIIANFQWACDKTELKWAVLKKLESRELISRTISSIHNKTEQKMVFSEKPMKNKNKNQKKLKHNEDQNEKFDVK